MPGFWTLFCPRWGLLGGPPGPGGSGGDRHSRPPFHPPSLPPFTPPPSPSPTPLPPSYLPLHPIPLPRPPHLPPDSPTPAFPLFPHPPSTPTAFLICDIMEAFLGFNDSLFARFSVIPWCSPQPNQEMLVTRLPAIIFCLNHDGFE
jgi:hypothetical protein